MAEALQQDARLLVLLEPQQLVEQKILPVLKELGWKSIFLRLLLLVPLLLGLRFPLLGLNSVCMNFRLATCGFSLWHLMGGLLWVGAYKRNTFDGRILFILRNYLGFRGNLAILTYFLIVNSCWPHLSGYECFFSFLMHLPLFPMLMPIVPFIPLISVPIISLFGKLLIFMR